MTSTAQQPPATEILPKEDLCALGGCTADHSGDLQTGYYCMTSPTRLTLPATPLVAKRADKERWIEVRRTEFTADTWDTFVNSSDPTIQLVTENDTIPMSEDETEQFIASLRFQLDQLASYRRELSDHHARARAMLM